MPATRRLAAVDTDAGFRVFAVELAPSAIAVYGARFESLVFYAGDTIPGGCVRSKSEAAALVAHAGLVEAFSGDAGALRRLALEARRLGAAVEVSL